jgi:hypothetical protein
VHVSYDYVTEQVLNIVLRVCIKYSETVTADMAYNEDFIILTKNIETLSFLMLCILKIIK